MAKSRGRRKKKPPSKASRTPAPETTAPRFSTLPSSQPQKSTLSSHLFKWILRIVGVLVSAIGIVAAIDGLFGPIWPTGPVFDLGYPVVYDPFTLAFTVTNPSIVFPIYDARIECVPQPVLTNKNWGFVGMGVVLQDHLYIGAPEQLQFSCPWKQVMSGAGEVTYADIIFTGSYHRGFPFFFREFSYTSDTFTWDSKVNPPRWTKGKPAEGLPHILLRRP
jgi:hypothetical protein